jgi:FlaA1/EpsC-like NDP-sugar epimerase
MNFPFICRNIPVYSVYISRLIWYCRASDYFDNLMYRWLLFMQKLLNQATFVSVMFFISSLTNTLDVIHIKHNVCLFLTEYILFTIYHDVFSRVYRRVWRYQRGNQNSTMNFQFICRNIPVYSVYISRLIWYCRDSDYFDNFMYRWLLFMQKLLNQACLVVSVTCDRSVVLSGSSGFLHK